MYNFASDYLEGAHPTILTKMMETNTEQTPGYGLDPYCEAAKEEIKAHLGNADVDIHFVVGGTQTNMLVIDATLRSHEAVIGVETAHINVHETGAIEHVGHKVVTVKGENGKVYPKDIETILRTHLDEHMVMPKMVFISNATEIGTIYTKAELTALSEYCHAYDLYLYMDGARLGSALCSEENDLTLEDIASLVDVFYIGGTKNGALFGEAIVICNPELKGYFRYNIKQNGAMLAKGRLLGIQFYELFKEDLFFELATHANDVAMELKRGLEKLQVEFAYDSPTNQQFIIVPKSVYEAICEKYIVSKQCDFEEDSVMIRLVASWCTPLSAICEFLADLGTLIKGNIYE